MKINLKLGNNTCIPFEINETEQLNGHVLKQLIEDKLNIDNFFLTYSSGININLERNILCNETFFIYPKVLGGKGGFGSLLRAFGKQITKSMNKEACRDLTGRRIRTINRDKRLKDLIERKAERAKQKEIEKKERFERRKKEFEKKHDFHDPKYDEQKKKIAEDIDDAITKGLNEHKKRKLESTADIVATTSENIVATTSSTTTVTTKKEKKETPMDKMNDWLGVQLNTSDEDSEEEDSDETQAKKVKI